MTNIVMTAPWMIPIIGLAFAIGCAVGFFLRCGIDRAELEAYRHIARNPAP